MKFLKYTSFALVFLMFGKITSSEINEAQRLKHIKSEFETFKNQYTGLSTPIHISKFSDPSYAPVLAALKRSAAELNMAFMEDQLKWQLSDQIYYASSLVFFERDVLNPALKRAGV